MRPRLRGHHEVSYEREQMWQLSSIHTVKARTGSKRRTKTLCLVTTDTPKDSSYFNDKRLKAPRGSGSTFNVRTLNSEIHAVLIERISRMKIHENQKEG